jgi:hypothetical protein
MVIKDSSAANAITFDNRFWLRNTFPDAVTFDSSFSVTGSFGVGEASPTKKFTVESSTNDGILLQNTSDTARAQLFISSGDDAFLKLYDTSDTLNVGLFTDGDSYILNDSFGLGTSSPQKKLHLNDDTNGADVGIRFEADTTGGSTVTADLEIDPDDAFLKLGYDLRVYNETDGSNAVLQFKADDAGSTTKTVNVTWDPDDVELKFDEPVLFTDGFQSGDNGTNLKFKVVDIGDWNMDSSTTTTVAHGLTVTDIRHAVAYVRNDANTTTHNLATIDGTGGSANSAGSVTSIDSTNVELARQDSSTFDGTDFDSTSYNRGWITIWYEAS